MESMQLILIASLVVALVAVLAIRKKQNQGGAEKPGKSGKRAAGKQAAAAKDEDGWVDNSGTASEQASEEGDEEAWEWDVGSEPLAETAVSAQEVDPLTEYQVYKQFGYEDKAAESLAGYLNKPGVNAPVHLVNELVELSLNSGNIDLLATTLEKHGKNLPADKLAEFIKAGLSADANHLGLRVLAESKLNWDVQEVARQIGEKTGLEADSTPVRGSAASEQAANTQAVNHVAAAENKYSPLIIGKAEVAPLTADEMSAVIGFVKPESSIKILKNQADYQTSLLQYNRAIEQSQRPAGLIIDALRLDYQNANINEFAAHLWRLYHSLGQNGRQVKERMLGWGYSLGQHEVFDDLEKAPTDRQVREIGIENGYLQTSAHQAKSKYRELVLKSDTASSDNLSPVELVLKEADSLLMYGQLEHAMATLEQAVLKYPAEPQLYIQLFSFYERAEDWERLKQFLVTLRTNDVSLPEEVVLAMNQLLQRVNRG